MNLKCANCGGSVILNPETGQMECTQCKGVINAGFSMKKTDMDISDSPLDHRTASEFAKKDRAERYLKESKKNIDELDSMGVGIDGVDFSHDMKGDAAVDETTKSEEDLSGDDRTAYMKMDLYSCTSCGAKLMMNSKETASFCAYCGQPTIIFERVSDELQPDIVVPFSITKEKAVSLIKEKFMQGRFVPDEIKNFEVDKLRGIYIPFWLVSTNNRCEMKIVATRTEREFGKEVKKTINVFRDLECDYDRITFDASRRLNNTISKRLEPYDMSKAVTFDMGYLSGFYADRYDVPASEAVYMAKQRSETFIETQIFEDCADMGALRKKSDEKTTNVTDIEYAMLPAWFITFRYKGIIYTVVVNGQTGKVVGNVPVNKSRVGFALAVLTMAITMVTTFLTVFGGNLWYDYYKYYSYHGIHRSNSQPIGAYIVLAVVLFSVLNFVQGIVKAKAYKMDGYKFSGSGTAKYVKKRQDKTWVR